METKYLRFNTFNLSGRKTAIVEVCSKSSDTLLGEIKWYGPWRQYCFFPLIAIFNSECLDDIKKFMDVMNKK